METRLFAADKKITTSFNLQRRLALVETRLLKAVIYKDSLFQSPKEISTGGDPPESYAPPSLYEFQSPKEISTGGDTL